MYKISTVLKMLLLEIRGSLSNKMYVMDRRLNDGEEPKGHSGPSQGSSRGRADSYTWVVVLCPRPCPADGKGDTNLCRTVIVDPWLPVHGADLDSKLLLLQKRRGLWVRAVPEGLEGFPRLSC